MSLITDVCVPGVFIFKMSPCELVNATGYLPTDVLPPPSEEFDEASGIKKLIEYKFNEDGKKVKVSTLLSPVILLKNR